MVKMKTNAFENATSIEVKKVIKAKSKEIEKGNAGEKESKKVVKKIELIMSYDVTEAFVIDSSKRKREFVMRYWFDEINYKGEEKPRFEYLPMDSEFRNRCSLILEKYKLDNSVVRFEEAFVYIMLNAK
jgi:hypothetical protein